MFKRLESSYIYVEYFYYYNNVYIYLYLFVYYIRYQDKGKIFSSVFDILNHCYIKVFLTL